MQLIIWGLFGEHYSAIYGSTQALLWDLSSEITPVMVCGTMSDNKMFNSWSVGCKFCTLSACTFICTLISFEYCFLHENDEVMSVLGYPLPKNLSQLKK